MNRATFDHLWGECDRIVDRGVSDTFHMRQMATTMQTAGYEPPMIFAGLVHDLLKPIADVEHGTVAALAFAQLGDEPVTFMRHHSAWVAAIRRGDSQSLSYSQRLLGRLDAAAFSAHGPCEPLAHFETLLDSYLS